MKSKPDSTDQANVPERRQDALLTSLWALGLLLLLLACPSIPGGDDAYRHVTYAYRLIHDPAAALADPWHLRYFPRVDIWFGYHLLLAPFTLVLDRMVAVKLLSSLLFGWLAYVQLRLLRLLGVTGLNLWLAISLAGSALVLHRIALCRPFLLSTVLVMVAGLLVFEGKRFRLAVASVAHAISYSMFFFVALLPGVYLLLRRDRRAFHTALLCGVGVMVGTLLNPFSRTTWSSLSNKSR